MNDRIEKAIEIKAPPLRVWKALTDFREFGEWFRVRLDGPFVLGQESTGNMTIPGYEHVQWHAVVCKMEPASLFSFTWHPYAIEPGATIRTRNRPWSSSTLKRQRQAPCSASSSPDSTGFPPAVGPKPCA